MLACEGSDFLDLNKYSTDNKVVHLSKDLTINQKLSALIGKKFDDYRVIWDKANNLDIVTDFPLFLQLDISQNCNLRCPQCMIGNPEYLPEYYNDEIVDFELYKKIIDEASSFNCPSLSVQGNNEPLLWPDFEKYIQYAREKGFIDIMINSNATLLTPKRVPSLLNCGLTRLRFSIDAATSSTYEKIRVGGNFNRVIDNINYLLEYKKLNNITLPLIGVSFVKQAANEHEEADFIAYWKDRVDQVSIQTFVPPVLDNKFSSFYPKNQLADITYESFRCVQPFQRIVLRNTEITPCCSTFSSKLSLGDIRTTSIHQAWHSDKMNELRRIHSEGKWKENDICKQCVNLIYPLSQSK